MSDNEESYSLLVSFSDQSPSFTHGFEAGILWEKLNNTTEDFTSMLHTENKTVIEDMAKSVKCEAVFMPTEYSEWTEVSFHWFQAEPLPKLRVVQGGLSK